MFRGNTIVCHKHRAPGFDSGRARQLAQISLHVDVGNYGVVENIHEGLMHVLAQYIRQTRIDPDKVGTLRF